MATAIPENRASFSVDEVVRITRGKLVRGGGGGAVTGISTDSRSVRPGSAFVALVGDRFDGHAFLDAVAQAGASALIVSRAGAAPEGPAIIEVPDTRIALGQLGRAHRLRWAGQTHPDGARALVAITGSAGKTTTRKAVAALLEAIAPGQVHASVGNLNNDIGVPMTLLGLEPEHRWAVVELGTSARGEIARLSELAAPDAGVLTLVAPAHTAGIGTVDDVAVEKGALLAALGEGGIAVANADDPRVLSQLSRTHARQVVTYGFDPRASYRILTREPIDLSTTRLRIERPERVPRGARRGVIELRSPLLGDAGALAVAAALAVAEALTVRSMSAERVAAALAPLALATDGRLAASRLADGTVVIDDSYNANPASMRASIATAAELARHEGRRLVLVLGEMRELGPFAADEHAAIGDVVARTGAAHLIAVSGEASRIAERARAASISAEFVPDAGAAAARALASVRAGDLVLVKGSRGVGTEQVVRALVDRSVHKGGAP